MSEMGIRNPFRNPFGGKKKKRKVTLGMTPVTFTASSGGELDLKAIPQKPFQATRMVLAEARTGAAGALLAITGQTVAGDNEMAGTEPTLFSAYSATAVGAGVAFRRCAAGLTIAIRVKNVGAAVTGTDQVVASGQFYGLLG